MNIRIVQNLPIDDWCRFVENHPDGNVFHTPEMFQVFSNTKGYRPELWAATENERIQALLLPVRIKITRGVPLQFATRSIVYGGVLCLPDAKGREAVTQLLQTYIREAYGTSLFTELRNLTDMSLIQPLLREHGFVYHDYVNFLINLKGHPKAVLKRIGPRTRKHIRRGLRRRDIAITEVVNREQVATCYALVQKSYSRAQIPLSDYSLFEAAFDLMYPKNMVKFTLAWLNHIPIAASVDLVYKDIVYGWYCGMDRSYGSYLPNELLTWHILKWGSENGFSIYDFGGAGKPNLYYGVRNFKAKFGGELVSYGRNTFVQSPLLLRLSELGYSFLRGWLYA